jgi:hypothetical protein
MQLSVLEYGETRLAAYTAGLLTFLRTLLKRMQRRAKSAQRIVTVAIAPSQRARDGASSKIDLPDGESGKFFREGLDSLAGSPERGSDLPSGTSFAGTRD